MPYKIYWDQLVMDGYDTAEEMLRDLYCNKNMSLHDISLIIGIDKDPIRREMRRIGIEIRPKGRPKGIKDKVEIECRETGPEGFFENSRDGEKRDCAYYDKCLFVCAILDTFVVPCVSCKGMPKSIKKMEKLISDFEKQLDSDGKITLPWHASDGPRKTTSDSPIALNKKIRERIEKENLSEMPMSASDFRAYGRKANMEEK